MVPRTFIVLIGLFACGAPAQRDDCSTGEATCSERADGGAGGGDDARPDEDTPDASPVNDVCLRAAREQDNNGCAGVIVIDVTEAGIEIAGDTTGYSNHATASQCSSALGADPNGGEAFYTLGTDPGEDLVVEVIPSRPDQDIVLWGNDSCSETFTCESWSDAAGPGQPEVMSFQPGLGIVLRVDSPAGHEGCFTLRAHVE